MSEKGAIAPPFVSHRGRLVATIIAVTAIVVFGATGFLVPGDKWSMSDRVQILGLGLAIAALMSRYATIRAIPRADGLWVRNLGGPRLVAWNSIEAIRFSDGMPWVRMDLDDGDEVAVMAIQRADGPRSVDEAQRLADLIAAQGPTGTAEDREVPPQV